MKMDGWDAALQLCSASMHYRVPGPIFKSSFFSHWFSITDTIVSSFFPSKGSIDMSIGVRLL